MPIAALNAYLNHLEARQVETKLMLADAIMLPHVKKEDYQSKLNGWKRILDIHQSSKPKIASLAKLKLLGIKVNHVKK